MNEIDFEVVEEDGAELIDVNSIFEVLSKTEYANCESAASEIIDNSIDAQASEILIELFANHDHQRGTKRLNKILFIDNGEGMSAGRLQHILSIGRSIGDAIDRIGRFGVGLKQASLFACKKFTVYSWKSSDQIYYVELDTDKYRETGSKKIPAPSKFDEKNTTRRDSLYQKFREHGTAVVWENFREYIVPAKPETLENRFKEDFSIKYRKFLDEGFNISIRNSSKSTLTKIQVNDMLFLSENNYKLGDPNGSARLITKEEGGEPLFEPFNNKYFTNGECRVSVPYDTNDLSKTDDVIIKAAIIKEKFYYKCAYENNILSPGNSEIGKLLGSYQERYISIVRNNREIDYGNFKFYKSINKPEHRWFKLEINFSDKLDNVFNVSNNKQKVELSYKDVEEYTINDVHYPIWKRLETIIKTTVSDMDKRNGDIASYYKTLMNDKNNKIDTNNLILDNIKEKTEKNNEIKKENKYLFNPRAELFIKEEKLINNSLADFLKANHISLEIIPNINNDYDCNYSIVEKKYIIILNEDYYNKYKNKEQFKYILLYIKYLSEYAYNIEDHVRFIKILESLGE